MAEKTKRPAAKMRQLDDEVLQGHSIETLKCSSCSGYGNCGYRAYYLHPEGKGVVSICMQRRAQLMEKANGE